MTEVKKKRFREKIGQVFQIPLSNGKFGYCQMASESKHAFFNYVDDGVNSDLKKIISSPVLFYICVDRYIFKEGFWKLMGCEEVKHPYIYKEQFSYDDSRNIYLIWKVIDGKLQRIPATPEEIQDLECFSSWSGRGARERLEDTLAGRPNFWVERAKNQHNPHFQRHIVEFYKQYGYDYKLDEQEIE